MRVRPSCVGECWVQKQRLFATSTTESSSYYSIHSSSKSKRHSLGIILPASPGPRPLHLLDGTITSSSASASIAKVSRRQSSISYYSPDRTSGYYTSSSINLNNAPRSPSSAQSVHVGAGLSRSSSVGRGSPALKGRHGEFQRMSLPLERESPPLTLAEK